MSVTFGELKENPLGFPISLIAGDMGLQRVVFKSLKAIKMDGNNFEEEPSLKGLEVIGTLINEINEYLFGLRKGFSIDIDWQSITGFQREVLQITYEIPFGSIRNYGGIAKQLGKPGSARAVGRALSENPMLIVIPCHRVIGADQRLHGFAAPDGIKSKAHLLRIEGHTIQDDKVIMK